MPSKRAYRMLAEPQFGAVGRDQLLAVGFSRRAIDHLVATGELSHGYSGTYLVSGTPRTHLQRLFSAYLWAGQGSAFSHRCAGAQWGLDGMPDHVVELTTHRRISAKGIVVHTGRLGPRDVRRYKSLPLTVPEKTLLDLGAVVPPLTVEIAADSAFRLGLTTLDRTATYVADNGGPGVRGSGVLRGVVAERLLDSGRPRSALETLFRRLVVDSSLARAAMNFDVYDDRGFIACVDAAWPHKKVAGEAAGWEFHMGRVVWKNDLRRLNRLIQAGWRVLYFTYEDITQRPHEVIAQLAALLYD